MTPDVSQPAASIPSPCVRNCCLDENDICRGCYRSLTEICGWSKANYEERRSILDRCVSREQQLRGSVSLRTRGPKHNF